MKVTVKIPTEIDVAFVDVIAPVRYGTEDMPADFPLREGDTWKARIDLDTATIVDWPQGSAGCVNLKVVDEGIYHLIDRTDTVIASLVNEYVPNLLIPGEYGDYIGLEIDETGKITNWLRNPSLEEFFHDEN